MEAGVNILEQTITNKITVDIDVGYGEYANNSLLPAGISEGGPQSYSLSYSDLRSLLALDGTTAAAILGVNSLPNTSSLDGQSNFFVGTAEAKALGLLNNDGTVTSEGLAFGLSDDGGLPDGWTGFGTGFTGTSLIDATLHEIAHALGALMARPRCPSIVTRSQTARPCIISKVAIRPRTRRLRIFRSTAEPRRLRTLARAATRPIF